MSPAPRAIEPLVVVTLARRGLPIRVIARTLGISRNAVRRALRERPNEEPSEGGPTVSERRASKLDPHRDEVARLLERWPLLTVGRIEEEIRAHGYTGGRTILKALVRALRPRPSVEPYDRIETAPGLEAQVDWSPMPAAIAGGVVTVYALSVVLCWSRMLFVRFFRRHDTASLLAGLVLALRFFGAVPMKMRFDNPTSIVAVRLGPAYRFQERLLALARHYGFLPVTARVRKPRDKAKVERPFQDIDRQFVYGRVFESFERVNEDTAPRLERWNARVHDTTGERPVDRLEQERHAMLPLPAADFDTRLCVPTRVGPDFCVAFDGVRYSAPPRLAGEPALVRADEAIVEVVHAGVVVARHERSGKKRERIVLDEHRAELRAMRRDARAAASAALGAAAADPDGYDAASRSMLDYGLDGERYLAALVSLYRGGARHQLRLTLELRARLGDVLFRCALERAAAYGAAGAPVIERIADDLVRRGVVARPAPDLGATVDASALGRLADVTVRPLAYYHEILAAESAAIAPDEDEDAAAATPPDDGISDSNDEEGASAT